MSPNADRDVTRRLLTPAETARYGGWSVSFVYKAIARGIFPAVRIGKSVRIDKDDLDALIRRSKVGPVEPIFGPGDRRGGAA